MAIKEEYLLTGYLEPTNDAYAIAKIAGILQIQSMRNEYGLPWISAVPTNLYGPGDNLSSRHERCRRSPARGRRVQNVLFEREQAFDLSAECQPQGGRVTLSALADWLVADYPE